MVAFVATFLVVSIPGLEVMPGEGFSVTGKLRLLGKTKGVFPSVPDATGLDVMSAEDFVWAGRLGLLSAAFFVVSTAGLNLMSAEGLSSAGKLRLL
jgi:hypothetical protein